MKTKSKPTIYQQAQHFADVTIMFLAKGQISRAQKCLKVAEDIFTNGKADVKNAISNIFLYSVSGFMELHRCDIKALLPIQLKTEYYKQVNTSGL